MKAHMQYNIYPSYLPPVKLGYVPLGPLFVASQDVMMSFRYIYVGVIQLLFLN